MPGFTAERIRENFSGKDLEVTISGQVAVGRIGQSSEDDPFYILRIVTQTGQVRKVDVIDIDDVKKKK